MVTLLKSATNSITKERRHWLTDSINAAGNRAEILFLSRAGGWLLPAYSKYQNFHLFPVISNWLGQGVPNFPESFPLFRSVLQFFDFRPIQAHFEPFCIWHRGNDTVFRPIVEPLDRYEVERNGTVCPILECPSWVNRAFSSESSVEKAHSNPFAL